MNPILLKTLEETCPKFNENITEGTAAKILKTVPAFLDDYISRQISTLPSNIKLKYLGYRRLTPEEEFKEHFPAANNGKIIYDLAVSDIYMVCFMFEYNGNIIKRMMYLPFAERGNLMRISNTVYHIVPVLSDTVISPSYNEVFVRLFKDKLQFKSELRNFIVNKQKKPIQIIYANIIKVNENQIKNNIGGKPLPAISLYLVGEYGLRKTLEKYLNIPNITNECLVFNTPTIPDEIAENYNVYESTKIRPWGLKEVNYTGTNLKICLHKSIKITPFIDNFIAGLIYSMELLPDNNPEDFVKNYNNKNVENEKNIWRIMLGRIAFKNTYSIDRIVEDIKEHFDALQSYMDNHNKSKLLENGIYVENFFDLLAVILNNYNEWLLSSKEYNSDIQNRYIDILYYILYEIIIGFNKVIINLIRRAKKDVNKEPSLQEVNKIFSNEWSVRKIFGLVKSNQMNISMMVADNTVDIMYPKITSLLEDQSRGNGVKRGRNTQFPDSTKTLRGHDLILGSLLFLPKQAPSPRFKFNLYLDYDIWSGKIKIPKDLTKTIYKLDNMLQGRIDDNSEKISFLEETDNTNIDDIIKIVNDTNVLEDNTESNFEKDTEMLEHNELTISEDDNLEFEDDNLEENDE